MKTLRLQVDRIMRLFNSSVLAILTLLTVWQVFTRYVLHKPSTWSEELSSYLFCWITLLGAAYVFGKREHMNIPVVIERFSLKTQRYIAVVNEIIVLIFSITILIWGGIAITKLTFGQLSSSLGIPMGYFYAMIPVSGVFIAIYSVLNIYDLLENEVDPIVEDVDFKQVEEWEEK